MLLGFFQDLISNNRYRTITLQGLTIFFKVEELLYPRDLGIHNR